MSTQLTERERKVLEAVIETFVETAQPAASRQLARKFGLGVSPATIRNTMSDLEEKGLLYHPHTSAGRVPTDAAYRVYVDGLLPGRPLRPADQRRLARELAIGGAGAVDTILRRAAQSLGILAQELGVVLGPSLEDAVLRRVDLVRLTSERLLLVLTLERGSVRTIFVETQSEMPEAALAEVTRVLNERLGGLTLREVRQTVTVRLRDSVSDESAAGLLNVFIEEGDQLFDASFGDDTNVVLGQASVLADQPEFASGEGMRRLVALTETRQHLAEILRRRSGSPGISITIGREHNDPALESFTLVTSEYKAGPLNGVIGVIGPTRMPYEKVISLVSHASQLVGDLLE